MRGSKYVDTSRDKVFELLGSQLEDEDAEILYSEKNEFDKISIKLSLISIATIFILYIAVVTIWWVVIFDSNRFPLNISTFPIFLFLPFIFGWFRFEIQRLTPFEQSWKSLLETQMTDFQLLKSTQMNLKDAILINSLKYVRTNYPQKPHYVVLMPLNNSSNTNEKHLLNLLQHEMELIFPVKNTSRQIILGIILLLSFASLVLSGLPILFHFLEGGDFSIFKIRFWLPIFFIIIMLVIGYLLNNLYAKYFDEFLEYEGWNGIENKVEFIMNVLYKSGDRFI